MRLLLAIVLLGTSLLGQTRANLPLIGTTAQMPASCTANWDLYIATDDAVGHKAKLCNPTGNGWDDVGASVAGSSVPAGSIIFISTGTCSAGWTEATELSGKTIFGTLAANADVGTDSSTTGGVAKAVAQTPTFTGSALATHTHTLTATGTNSAPAFTGSALATHTHTVTATGTNSAPAFTGTQFDNRSAFVKLIACKKN